MNNYNRDKMFKREDSYPKAIRIAVLVAIFFHIGLLYGFRHSDPPEKLEPPKPTPIIRVHSLPPSEPTPPPKRTQPPRVQISEDKRLVPKRPPKVKEPVAVPLPMNPELDPMEIEPDWAQIVDDIPEPEPIDADP